MSHPRFDHPVLVKFEEKANGLLLMHSGPTADKTVLKPRDVAVQPQ